MFASSLVIEAHTQPDFWIVRAPLVWCDATYGRLVVPVGFVTDLASIPRTLRNLPAFDPNGHSRRPAVVHDWLYQWQTRPKAVADAFLRDAMLADGCDKIAADAFYDAVHWFGQHAWDCDHARTIAASFIDAASYQAWVSLPSQ